MSPIPLYEQIEKALREGIAKGDIVGENALLPSEEELCKTFEVSRITIRKALAGLVSDGLIIRRAGKGTFVLPEKKKIIIAMVGNLDDIATHDTGFKLLGQKVIPAPAPVKEKLRLNDRTRVFWYQGFRRVGRKPYAFFDLYVPAEWGQNFTPPDLNGRRNIISLIQEISGTRAIEASQWVSASIANREVAKILKMKMGDPVLLVERIYFAREKKPMELAISHIRPDLYQFNIQYMARNVRF